MQYEITRSRTYLAFVADQTCFLSTVAWVAVVAAAAAAAADIGAWTVIPFLSDDAAPHDVLQRRYPWLTYVPRPRRRRRTSHPHRHAE